MKRTSSLSRSSGFKQRTPMKKSSPKRDWSAARDKVEAEFHCRACKCPGGAYGATLEAAHVIGRDRDAFLPDPPWISPEGPYLQGGKTWPVEPARIVPLCRDCHRAYDAHELDILPALTLEEQLQAVRDAGGLENARVRTAPSQYGKDAA